jgi:Fe-S oxidoreductase
MNTNKLSDRARSAEQHILDRIDSRIASFFSSCVHCGMCAEACHFYKETGNPKYTPIYKLEPMRKIWKHHHTFWGKLFATLGLSTLPDEQMLEDWQELVYDSCTLCSRCSLVCPVGIDIAYMVRQQREGFSTAGFAPEGLKGASERSIKLGSPMGVTATTLLATIKHQEEECGIPIPVDQQDSDYLVLLSSLEIVGFPEYIGAIARIFKQADISWTISTSGFEATNSGIQIGNSEIAREIVERVVNVAESLRVKAVISPECGHAYTSIRWDAPNLLGRELPFKVIHILELLHELQTQGKLKTVGTFDTPLTYHDPCSIARKGGVIKEPRDLLNQVSSNFREMTPSGEMNWCCGGGGGVSAIDEAEELRFKAFHRKSEQVNKLGVKVLVTACANCRNTIEEGLENYEMDVEVIGLTELIAGQLESAG